MGKYIKKSKTAREMTVMDASQSYIGVRTRAKTLALQRLQKFSNSAPPSSGTSVSYLQLRSRRLQKSPNIALPNESRKQKLTLKNGTVRRRKASSGSRATSRLGVYSVASASIESVARGCVKLNEEAAAAGEVVEKKTGIQENGNIRDVAEIGNRNQEEEEASFGENILDRTSRESTPSSLVRNPESTQTPGSSTKISSTSIDRIQQENSFQSDVPLAHEVDDFFNCVEEEQQRRFIKKYNFDPIKDKPLPGRYEWEKLD